MSQGLSVIGPLSSNSPPLPYKQLISSGNKQTAQIVLLPFLSRRPGALENGFLPHRHRARVGYRG